jgi:hypothetical protein
VLRRLCGLLGLVLSGGVLHVIGGLLLGWRREGGPRPWVRGQRVVSGFELLFLFGDGWGMPLSVPGCFIMAQCLFLESRLRLPRGNQTRRLAIVPFSNSRTSRTWGRRVFCSRGTKCVIDIRGIWGWERRRERRAGAGTVCLIRYPPRDVHDWLARVTAFRGEGPGDGKQRKGKRCWCMSR